VADQGRQRIADYASFTAQNGDTVYCMGNANEFDYTAFPSYRAWKCKDGKKESWNINLDGVSPYAFAVLSDDCFVVADAGDYFNPGSVTLFSGGEKKWTVTAGVCPGHFAIW
jgi:hypothetical protein